MPLYTKYRPTSLNQVIGNNNLLATLSSIIHKEDPPHSYLFHGPTGCGKTTLARIVATELNCVGNDFREVDSADFRGIDTIREIRRQALFKPLEGTNRAWILDECFAKGTHVSTPEGPRQIEDMKPGDQIYSVQGKARVQAVFKNIVFLDRIVRVDLSTGTSIYCTKQHLFLTKVGSWIEASQLQIGQQLWSAHNVEQDCGVPSLSDLWGTYSLCNNLERTIEQENVQPEVWEQTGWTDANQPYGLNRDTRENRASTEEGSRSDNRKRQTSTPYELNQNASHKSYAQQGTYPEYATEKGAEWNIACVERGEGRERKINDSTTAVGSSLRLVDGGINSNGPLQGWEWLPTQLQSGHRKQRVEDCHRDRWQRTSTASSTATGQKKRKEIAAVRVARVTFYERGSNEQSFRSAIGHREREQGYAIFYDLEIDRHSSYFANGVGVHNCHQLSTDAQNALLKVLEDTPKHVYFFLCTTNPQKLLDTIKGRCTQFQVSPLSSIHMKKVLRDVVAAEQESLDREVYEQIILDAQGRPRAALQILENVLAVEPDLRLDVARQAAEQQSKTIELCRALIDGSPWSKVRLILAGLSNEDPEQIRRAVMGYCSAVMLKGDNDRAGVVLEEFVLRNFFDSGHAGLTYTCGLLTRE